MIGIKIKKEIFNNIISNLEELIGQKIKIMMMMTRNQLKMNHLINLHNIIKQHRRLKMSHQKKFQKFMNKI